MPSATMAQLASRSAWMAPAFNSNLPNPFCKDCKATKLWPSGTLRFRNTVESVRSRCSRLMGNFSAKCCNTALDTPQLPSAFSKSMGFTL